MALAVGYYVGQYFKDLPNEEHFQRSTAAAIATAFPAIQCLIEDQATGSNMSSVMPSPFNEGVITSALFGGSLGGPALGPLPLHLSRGFDLTTTRQG
jgi:hypothetical protein